MYNIVALSYQNNIIIEHQHQPCLRPCSVVLLLTSKPLYFIFICSTLTGSTILIMLKCIFVVTAWTFKHLLSIIMLKCIFVVTAWSILI